MSNMHVSLCGSQEKISDPPGTRLTGSCETPLVLWMLGTDPRSAAGAGLSYKRSAPVRYVFYLDCSLPPKDIQLSQTSH